MLEAAIIVTGIVFAVWFYLLFDFHRRLQKIDPEISNEIGKPSIFWTAFTGHSHLVRLIRRSDLAETRYAPLEGKARLLRVWAILLIASLIWTVWAYAR